MGVLTRAKTTGMQRKTGLDLARKGSEDTTLAFLDARGLL
jgi:hypothetical protein